MHLTPQELDKLVLHQAGFLAQKRLARGVRLNYPEAVALIATQLLEFIRDGARVAELMQRGRELLGHADVMPGVPDMVHEVQVEGTFRDGTKLVTVHQPIVAEYGNLELALYGSFLPVPVRATSAKLPATISAKLPATISAKLPATISATLPATISAKSAANAPPVEPPGAYRISPGEIALNAGRATLTMDVVNTGDRPVQVGSHYPMAEVNPALELDRVAARGMRLDIPAGTAVRFEPGERKTIQLVATAGTKEGAR